MDELSSTDAAILSPAPDATITQPPPRKRQLFKNRPAWSSQPTTTSSVAKPENAKDDGDDPLRAFSRANDTFRLIQEAEERARQEKIKESEEAERKEREEKRKMKERELAMYAKLTKNFESPARKKRKVSEELDGNGHEHDVVIEEEKVQQAGEEDALETGYATPPPSKSTRSTVTPRSSRKRQEHGVVELLDGADNHTSTPSKRTRPTPVPINDNDDEHKIRQPSPAPALTFTIDDDSDTPHTYQPSQSNRPSISRTPSTQQASTQQPQPPPPPPPPPNPVLSLLIHSPIPNTTPLLVKRRLNQRLKEVRLAWINKQINGPLPPHPYFPVELEKIFLTWRNKRCYDFTSCASLGLIVDELTGEVVVKRKDSDIGGPGASGMSVNEEREWKDAMAEGGAQLVLEAVTEEMLMQRKKGVDKNGVFGVNPSLVRAEVDQYEHAINRMTNNGKKMPPQSLQVQDYSHPAPGEEGTGVEPKIKIILRAGKEYEDYKLQVRPVSLFYTLLLHSKIGCRLTFQKSQQQHPKLLMPTANVSAYLQTKR